MIKWFIKSGLLLQSIVMIVLLFIFWLPAFTAPLQAIVSTFDGPIYTFIIKNTGLSVQFEVFIAFVLLIIQAIGFTLVLQFSGLIHKSNLLPSIAIVIGYSWNPQFLTLHPFLFTGVLLLFALYFLMQLYGKNNAYHEVFSASFCLGLASLFFIPLVLLLIVIWATFITLRVSEWREYVISIIAFTLPLLYYASGLYWNANLVEGSVDFINSMYMLSLSDGIGMSNIIWLSACAFTTIISVLFVLSGLNDKLLNVRRKNWVLGDVIIVSLLPLIATGFLILNVSYLFVLPVSYFISAMVVFSKRSLFVDILLIGLVSLLIFVKLYEYF